MYSAAYGLETQQPEEPEEPDVIGRKLIMSSFLKGCSSVHLVNVLPPIEKRDIEVVYILNRDASGESIALYYDGSKWEKSHSDGTKWENSRDSSTNLYTVASNIPSHSEVEITNPDEIELITSKCFQCKPPLSGKIYLEKVNENELKFITQHKGKKIEGTINIDMKEELTQEKLIKLEENIDHIEKMVNEEVVKIVLKNKEKKDKQKEEKEKEEQKKEEEIQLSKEKKTLKKNKKLGIVELTKRRQEKYDELPYKLALISELPEDKIPEKGKLYIKKQGKYLNCTFVAENGEVINKKLDITIDKKQKLTPNALNTLKYDILGEALKKDFISPAFVPIKPIPDIVKSKVNKIDLHEGMLLTPDDIYHARQWLEQNQDKKNIRKDRTYSYIGEDGEKVKFKLPLSVMKSTDGEIYALYLGGKHNTELGAGVFSSVKLGQNLSTADWVAIKTQRHHEADDIKDIKYEESILAKVQQALGDQSLDAKNNALKKKEIIVMPLLAGTAFENNQVTFRKQVLEISDIEDPHQRSNKIVESALFSINASRSLFQNIDKLHKNNILHRDLHPGNILVDKNGAVTIIDYGNSVLANSPESKSLTTRKGTGTYADKDMLIGRKDILSPEILKDGHLRQEHQYTTQDDMYAASRCVNKFMTFDLLNKYGEELGIPKHELDKAIKEYKKLEGGCQLEQMYNLQENGIPEDGKIYVNKINDNQIRYLVRSPDGRVVQGTVDNIKLNGYKQWSHSLTTQDLMHNDAALNSCRNMILSEMAKRGHSPKEMEADARPSAEKMEAILSRLSDYVKLKQGIDIRVATQEEIENYNALAEKLNNNHQKIKVFSESEKEAFLADFPNLAKQNPTKAYKNLCLIANTHTDVAISDEMKLAIIENVNAIKNVYNANYDESGRIPLNEKDPLVMALRWHSSLEYTKGRLNESRAILAEIISADQQVSNFPEIVEFLKNCTFLDQRVVNNLYIDIDAVASNFYKQDNTDIEREQFENQLSAFLIQTHPNQRFVNANEGLSNIIERKKIHLLDLYFENKVSPFTKKDIAILSDVNTYNKLNNKLKIYKNAVAAMKSENAEYYKDKSNWLPIVLSKDHDAITALHQHVLSSSHQNDISYLSRIYTEVLHKVNLNLDEKLNHQNQRNTLLEHAAIRGDKYAKGKLASIYSIDENSKAAVVHVMNKVCEIDTLIANLQERGLQTKIPALKMLKESIIQHTDQCIVDKTHMDSEFIPQINNMLNANVVRSAEKQLQQDKRFNTALNVATLGIKPGMDWVESKAANLITGTQTKSSSAFQFWDQKYYTVIEAMKGVKESSMQESDLEKTKKEVIETQLKTIDEKMELLQGKLEGKDKKIFKNLFKSSDEKALEVLKKEKALLGKDLYRHNRNAQNLSDASEILKRFPGLEIEEQTVITEDGKHIDVLIVNNKAAQLRNGGPVADVVHFSGNECFYQLDDRHFEHAVSKGCNLVVVHDRLKSTNSRATTGSKEAFTQDGVAAVKHIIKIREEEAKIQGIPLNKLPEPIIHGYCGGGPTALYTHEAMSKERDIKFIADRTYHSTSAAVVSMYAKPYENDSGLEKLKKTSIKIFAKPLLSLVNFETDNVKRLKNIADDKLLYFDVRAPKKSGQEEEPYFEDYVIGKKANVHAGLEKERNKKMKKIDAFAEKVEKFKENICENNTLPLMDKVKILTDCEKLLNTLDHLKSSIENTQVKSTVDDAHRTETSAFLLHDNTRLDDTIQAFMHNSGEKERINFTSLNIDFQDKKLEEQICHFWNSCDSFYNEFYNLGKKMTDLNATEHDLRARMNDIIVRVNDQSSRKVEDVKTENKQENHAVDSVDAFKAFLIQSSVSSKSKEKENVSLLPRMENKEESKDKVAKLGKK